jgi:hypothetical protein
VLEYRLYDQTSDPRYTHIKADVDAYVATTARPDPFYFIFILHPEYQRDGISDLGDYSRSILAGHLAMTIKDTTPDLLLALSTPGVMYGLSTYLKSNGSQPAPRHPPVNRWRSILQQITSYEFLGYDLLPLITVLVLVWWRGRFASFAISRTMLRYGERECCARQRCILPPALDAVTIAGIFTPGEVCMLYRLMRIAPHVTRMIPRHVRWRLGGIAAVLAYWCWPEKRLATQKNMSVVLDLPVHHPQVRRTARLSWYNYGRVVADYFDLANHSTADYLREFDNAAYPIGPPLDIVDSLRTQGRGIIIPTAHFGNWDVAGIMVASRNPAYVIAEQLGDERQNRLFQEERRKFGLHVETVEAGGDRRHTHRPPDVA